MFIVNFLIPLADNNQVGFTAAEFAAWHAVLRDLFRGWTALRGEVAGEWVRPDGSGIDVDTHVVYFVNAESIRDGAKVIEAVEAAKVIFRQDAIFIAYLGLSEVID